MLAFTPLPPFPTLREEVHDMGLHRLVEYDLQGRPDGVNYEQMVLYLNTERIALYLQLQGVCRRRSTTRSVR